MHLLTIKDFHTSSLSQFQHHSHKILNICIIQCYLNSHNSCDIVLLADTNVSTLRLVINHIGVYPDWATYTTRPTRSKFTAAQQNRHFKFEDGEDCNFRWVYFHIWYVLEHHEWKIAVFPYFKNGGFYSFLGFMILLTNFSSVLYL